MKIYIKQKKNKMQISTHLVWFGICIIAMKIQNVVGVRSPLLSWDFRGCSGANLYDSHTNQINAKLQNGATCSSEGVVFDGNDDYVNFVNGWKWTKEPTTIEVYVKWTHFGNNNHWIFGSGVVNEDAIVLWYNVDKMTCNFNLRHNQQTTSLESPPSLKINEWTHIAITMTDSIIVMYINGVKVQEDNLNSKILLNRLIELLNLVIRPTLFL